MSIKADVKRMTAKQKNILIAFGTRPEAIKMCPLVHELKSNEAFNVKVFVTGQHREMLDSVLSLFNVVPDFDLDIMTSAQGVSDVVGKIMAGSEKIFEKAKPDLVLVHGDTATTLSVSLAAYFHKIPIGHVEAGLRTGNLYSPWPEEGNRKLVGALASLHFAPTQTSKENLLNEGVDAAKIIVTGNTVIDALIATEKQIRNSLDLENRLKSKLSFLDHRKILLVTGHRRESFGRGFEDICKALLAIEAEHGDEIQIVYPVHLNPNVQEPVQKLLSNNRSIHLIDPLDYAPFVYLMMRSHIILTDSGGVQEEGPSLGKPVLVMRETTERPEAVAANTVKLVGTEPDAILRAVSALLNDVGTYAIMSKAINPYGDGHACERIAAFIRLQDSDD